MPRVPGDVPQVPFQPTQMPGYAAPAVQPAQNFFPQQLQQLAAGVQDLGQASSRIGSAMQRQELANQEQAIANQKQQDREQERIQAKLQQEQDRLDDAGAKEAINQFRAFAADKSSEYGRLTGKEAAEGLPKYLSDIDKYAEDLRKGLANETQRKIFGGNSMLFGGDVRRKMSDYAYEQNSTYQRSTAANAAVLDSRSYVESSVSEFEKDKKIRESNGAIPRTQSMIDPKAYRASMEANIRWAMEGQPEEKIKVEIGNAVQALHSDTLEKFASKKHFAAINSYIDANESEMDPKAVAEYRKMATSTKASLDASKFAISIASKFRKEDGSFTEEAYSVSLRQIDILYASGNTEWDEETYKNVRTALRSLKESDAGVRTKIESDLVKQAVDQIEYLKSPEAREKFAVWSANEDGKAGTPYAPSDAADIPIYADNADDAERAFQQSNPVLYAKLDRAGLLDKLRDNFKGGGKSDQTAVLEIEDAINRDPNFLSSFPMEKFQSEYGLKLSREQYSSYVNKMLAARNKAASDADALSEGSQNLILNEALHSNGYANIDGTVDEEGKDKTKSKAVAATRADFRIQWDKHSASYRSSNSGKEPGRKEYKEFTDSYFADRKNTSIEKPVADITAQDLDTIVATHRDEKSGKVYASPLSQIDETLRNKAIARANDLNKNRVVVMVGGAPLERFATRTEAQNFIDSGKAKSLALYRNVTSTEFSINPKPADMISTAPNSTELGSLALEMLANGDYAFEGSPLAAPDSDIRTNNIIEFYLQKRSDARASPNIFIRGAMALGSSMEYAFEDKTFGQLNEQKVEQYKKTGEQSFVEFSKRIESIRDDVNDGDYPLNSRIDLGEVGDVSYALTGYNTDKLVQLGALKPVFKKTNVEWLEGGLDYYTTTPKFNELVQETYSYTVTKLKKQEIRK